MSIVPYASTPSSHPFPPTLHQRTSLNTHLSPPTLLSASLTRGLSGLPPSVSDWTPPMVSQYLTSIGLRPYARRFELERIRGVSLADLTDSDLRELGVSRMGDRKFFKKAVEHALKADEAARGRDDGEMREEGRRGTAEATPMNEGARNGPRTDLGLRGSHEMMSMPVDVVVKRKGVEPRGGGGNGRKRRMSGPPLIIDAPRSVGSGGSSSALQSPGLDVPQRRGRAPGPVDEGRGGGAGYGDGDGEGTADEPGRKRPRVPHLTIGSSDQDLTPLQLLDTPPGFSEAGEAGFGLGPSARGSLQLRSGAVDPTAAASPRPNRPGGGGGEEVTAKAVRDGVDPTPDGDLPSSRDPAKGKAKVTWDAMLQNAEIPKAGVTKWSKNPHKMIVRQNASVKSVQAMSKFRNRWGGATLVLEVAICSVGLANIWWQMLVFLPAVGAWMAHIQERAKTWMMAASQGCTGLGVWPYSEGSLVRVKDSYAREKLREKARKLLVKYLLFSLLALVGFLSFARFVIEPVLAPRSEKPGSCPVGDITNTTCNGRGSCNPGMDSCVCGGGFDVYEGETCQTVSPAFVIGMLVFTVFLAFTCNILYIAARSGDGGAPWIFDKDGNNKYRMRQLQKQREKKKQEGWSAKHEDCEKPWPSDDDVLGDRVGAAKSSAWSYPTSSASTPAHALEEGRQNDYGADDPSLAPKGARDFFVPMSLTPTHRRGDVRRALGFKYKDKG